MKKIWKIRKKSKLKCEMVWKILRRSKLNSEKIWKMGKCTTTMVRKKRGENDVTSCDVTSGHVPDVTSGHLPSNDVIFGDATSGYILKTNNPFLFVLGTSML